MKNTFDIDKYIQLKKDVKQHYNDIKLGEQNLYENQSNLFKPLSDITTAQSKEIQDKLVSNQDAFHNVIVPFTSNIEKRIEQLENLQSLPYYQIEEPEPKVTPSAPRIVQLNFDEDFTDAEKGFLKSQNLDMPSTVYEKQTPTKALDKIKTCNLSLGQSKRYGKITDEDYRKNKAIIKKYEERINQIRQGLKIPSKVGTGVKLLKQKRHRGRPKTKIDVVAYNDYNDLIEKLQYFISSYQAGNEGVYNYIVEILDELMRNNVISKSDYHEIHQNIF